LYFINQCGSKEGAQSSVEMDNFSPRKNLLEKKTNGSKDEGQSSAGIDNFSPRKNLLEKEPMAQKMWPKVVSEWTTFPQGKISLKKNQWLKR